MMLLWPPKKIIYLENFQISLDPPPTFGKLYCRCFSETPNIHLIESDPPPDPNWEISPQKNLAVTSFPYCHLVLLWCPPFSGILSGLSKKKNASLLWRAPSKIDQRHLLIWQDKRPSHVQRLIACHPVQALQQQEDIFCTNKVFQAICFSPEDVKLFLSSGTFCGNLAAGWWPDWCQCSITRRTKLN